MSEGASDPSHADDAESLARRPPDTARQPEVPGTLLDPAIEGDDAAGQCQDETESVIGDLVDAIVGDVPDGHPEFCCGDRVDGVEPDAVSTHGPDSRQGTKDAARDRGVLDDEGRRVLACLDHLVGGPASGERHASNPPPRGCRAPHRSMGGRSR